MWESGRVVFQHFYGADKPGPPPSPDGKKPKHAETIVAAQKFFAAKVFSRSEAIRSDNGNKSSERSTSPIWIRCWRHRTADCGLNCRNRSRNQRQFGGRPWCLYKRDCQKRQVRCQIRRWSCWSSYRLHKDVLLKGKTFDVDSVSCKKATNSAVMLFKNMGVDQSQRWSPNMYRRDCFCIRHSRWLANRGGLGIGALLNSSHKSGKTPISYYSAYHVLRRTSAWQIIFTPSRMKKKISSWLRCEILLPMKSYCTTAISTVQLLYQVLLM